MLFFWHPEDEIKNCLKARTLQCDLCQRDKNPFKCTEAFVFRSVLILCPISKSFFFLIDSPEDFFLFKTRLE